MKTTRLIPVLAVAWLAAGTACRDAVAPTDKTQPSGPSTPPAQISIVGFVHLSTDLRNQVTLRTDDGQEYALIGAGLTSIARVDSAEVEVRGGWTADGAFEVNDFVVRSVEGAPALDGILVARYDPAVDDPDSMTVVGYDLQLTRGGIIALADPSADLIAHVGARIWLTGDPTAAPTAFGVID
jgi:hypothetical protein